MIVMIDNYDSFTFNLVQHFLTLGAEMRVFRNDATSIEAVSAMNPEGIVISPGPGRPDEAGITIPLISALSGTVPILGVCLGHQAIGAAFGGRVVRAKSLMHGKTSEIDHDGRTIFSGLPAGFTAMRYHSLAVQAEGLPACLEVSARSEEGEIMGLRHRSHKTEGIQFHPESIMTPAGKRILRNFLALCEKKEAAPCSRTC